MGVLFQKTLMLQRDEDKLFCWKRVIFVLRVAGVCKGVVSITGCFLAPSVIVFFPVCILLLGEAKRVQAILVIASNYQKCVL